MRNEPADLDKRLRSLKLVTLAGGVGGARLVDGLAQVLPAENLAVIVNVGDDFEHLGLYICPDLDTVCYTLAGLANPETGWGRSQETFRALEVIGAMGGPDWFRLGDQDLGLHLERTRLLKLGLPLSEVTSRICAEFEIKVKVLPVSDDHIPTRVCTEQGEMVFQEYFVRQQCEPRVTGFRFEGIEHAAPTPGVLSVIEQADLIALCPSNPWVSLDPILAVPGIRSAIASRRVVGISPILGGKAVKGPAAKMYAELGIQPSALAVAGHYQDLLDGFLLDERDLNYCAEIADLGIQPFVADILMKTPADRLRLAGEFLKFTLQIP